MENKMCCTTWDQLTVEKGKGKVVKTSYMVDWGWVSIPDSEEVRGGFYER